MNPLTPDTAVTGPRIGRLSAIIAIATAAFLASGWFASDPAAIEPTAVTTEADDLGTRDEVDVIVVEAPRINRAPVVIDEPEIEFSMEPPARPSLDS